MFIEIEIPIEDESCCVEFPDDARGWEDKIQNENITTVISINNLGNGCCGAAIEIKPEFAQRETGLKININKRIIIELIDALNLIKKRMDLNHENEDNV